MCARRPDVAGHEAAADDGVRLVAVDPDVGVDAAIDVPFQGSAQQMAHIDLFIDGRRVTGVPAPGDSRRSWPLLGCVLPGAGADADGEAR